MELQEMLSGLNTEQKRKLAEAANTSELSEMAEKFGFRPTQSEAEVIFAALSPLREKELTDDEIESIAGGAGVSLPRRMIDEIQRNKVNAGIISE